MAGFPFTCRVRVLHPAFSALSALQDIVVPSDTLIGGSDYTLCVHRKAGMRVPATNRCLLLPAARESGRQPFCEAHQDQHDHSARQHYAEEDNTCRQVQMSRQVFAEPAGAQASAGSRATASLQRCRSQIAGANTKVALMTTKRPASRSCLPGLLRMGDPRLISAFSRPREASGLGQRSCSPVPSSKSGLIAARYSSCSAMCCSRLLA